MMSVLRSILCGALAALIVGGGAFAVGAGGFPSRPQLVALGIGIAAPTGGITVFKATGAGCSGAAPCALVTGTTNAVVNALPTGAASYGQFTVKGAATSSGGICTSDTANVCEANIPAGVLDVFSTGGTGINLQTGPAPLYIDHQPLSYGVYASNTGGCTLQGNDNLNMGSCTRNVGGDNTISFIKAYTAGPTCVATQNNGIGFVQTITTTTTVEVKTYDSAGTGADRTYAVYCW